MLVFHFSSNVLLADRIKVILQKGLFGGLTLGTHATVQLEFRRADRKPVKAASIKGKGSETEQLPLYTNKDSVVGEVSMYAGIVVYLQPCTRAPATELHNSCRSGLPTLLARRLSIKASKSSCLGR